MVFLMNNDDRIASLRKHGVYMLIKTSGGGAYRVVFFEKGTNTFLFSYRFSAGKYRAIRVAYEDYKQTLWYFCDEQ